MSRADDRESPLQTPPPNVVVLGSINMDVMIRCATLPTRGQTVSASSSREVCGGKGANQAVAAAKAGGSVRMIGRVGDDAFSQRLITNLVEHRVDSQSVRTTPRCASGLAIVAVEDSGENSILLVAGANGCVTPDDVIVCRDTITASDVLLMQLEIPTATVLAAAQIARDAGVRCILDPAPVPHDWTDRLLEVDLICPNETEAGEITGIPIETIADAEEAAKQLHRRGAKNVVITLGERGTLLCADGRCQHIAPVPIQAIDTTAAGDAFAGALAVRWAECDDLADAVRFASAAGALAATSEGAQPSLPARTEIEALRGTR
ncbi:ribokinase [Rhodopirellula rubra]|uniref:Ribokinase n=1 Tax=Aporhodopirellula rubra TaxID=980271 RepID=A0A7W5E477_9BACT|nr:ribokinase [Aporhodopirellula rubra]MBB3209479.1 ribokinase [Aporhodopirellula rubra]